MPSVETNERGGCCAHLWFLGSCAIARLAASIVLSLDVSIPCALAHDRRVPSSQTPSNFSAFAVRVFAGLSEASDEARTRSAQRPSRVASSASLAPETESVSSLRLTQSSSGIVHSHERPEVGAFSLPKEALTRKGARVTRHLASRSTEEHAFI